MKYYTRLILVITAAFLVVQPLRARAAISPQGIIELFPSSKYQNAPAAAQTPQRIEVRATTIKADVSRPRTIWLEGKAEIGYGREGKVYFEWGTSSSMSNRTNPQYISVGGNFFHSIIRATPNTNYYYRFVIEDASGRKYYGAPQSIKTPSWTSGETASNHLPQARTDQPQQMEYTWRLKGYAHLNGAESVQAYFEFGQNYRDLQTTSSMTLSADSSFDFTFARMDWSAPIHYRAVVKDALGRVHRGNFVTISSPPRLLAPEKTPAPVTGIPIQSRYDAWTLSGVTYWSRNGQNSTAYFEWGTTPSLGHRSESLPTHHTGVHYQPLSGLEPNQTYYYRFVYRDDLGVVRGNILNFTTCNYGTMYDSVSGTLTTGCK